MELRDYLRILRAHWVGILLLTILGAAVGYGYSALQPKVYTASASGIVQATGGGTDTGSALVGNQLAQSKVSSYVDIGGWRSVAESAIDYLDLDTTPEALVTRVTVSNPLNTVIINVSADGASPEEARDLAEAWVRGMVEQINMLENGTPGQAGAVTLVAGESASLPTEPSSPNTRLNIALGTLIGLALGIGYAVIRHVLDRRVRDPRAIERETGVSVVGTIPLEKQLTDARKVFRFDTSLSSATGAAITEAMRELRTNLQFMDVDNPPRVIVVTSPIPGDGKSTSAANLALSLAAAGQRTILIDADLRRPVVGTVFDLPEGAGLTDVLAGRARFEDVAHQPDASGNLQVLTAGRIPPNPSEVLGSQRMRDLVRELGNTSTVIIDSPPTIPVTDAAVLGAAADGVLLVVSAGRTTYDMMLKALENIAKANGRVLGVVLNKVPKRGAESGYYGYRYRGGYYAAEPAPTRRALRRTRAREQAETHALAEEKLTSAP
ncbi:polysaccharide biosynthesis tyrosine autokinase [Microbacterium telephonicum]|uniref:non-specific protein-tyrosine kinase n=1 Tax=Microbacterium telephonicum TaxID=1714841 RepID=A0A498BYY6_9MICO|nr:polysaccharide biosynthesis tyrosine autokinase [Microbacterium telephonicum]RLK48009.1 capsular exopolysaccharide synthesis family protein [Microbacterium telephonicum]